MKRRFQNRLSFDYFKLLTWGLIGYGIFLRLHGYFKPPSMWLDEAAQAVRLGSEGGFERYLAFPTYNRPFFYLLVNQGL